MTSFSHVLWSIGVSGALLAGGVACSSTSNDPGGGRRASAEGVGGTALPIPRRVDTIVGALAVRDLPGGPRTIVMWPSILADQSMYDAQIAAWRGRHRLLLIDGPGHGASGAAPGPFSMANCAEAVRQILDAHSVLQPVVVLGTSWGGLVAGEFAIAHPTRTEAVVMLNTPVFKEPGASFADRFIVWGARWLHTTGLFAGGVERAFFLPATREGRFEAMARFRAHLRDVDGAAMQSAVRAVLIDRDALAPKMERIATPTLFIAGSFDTMYPLSALRDAAGRLPRGRFVELPTQHLSAVDAPDATTRAIDRFLEELAPR